MKKECIYTRKSLRKYLSGHVFALQKIRIERHLKSCAIC
jgi:predicted anti-sigma-YlaC factor YlaD